MLKQTGFFLLLLFCFASCRQPRDLVYVGVQNFGLKQASLKKTVVSMDVQLYNPNNYKMKLRHSHLDIFINSNKLGTVNMDSKLKVPRLDTFAMPVMLDVDLGNALPNMLQLAFNSDVTVKLTGTVKAGRHGLYINIPVNYEGKQDIRQGIKW